MYVSVLHLSHGDRNSPLRQPLFSTLQHFIHKTLFASCLSQSNTMATVEIAASVPVALPPPEPIDPQYRPSTSVAKLPASAPVEEILKIIDRDGGIILEDFASEEELASIKTELDANEPVDFDTRRGASGITPQQTNLTPGLVGRSTTAASLCEKPVLDKVRAHILTDRWPMTRGSYHIERQIDPLLSLSIGFDIGPGAHRQYLHRDDAVHNIRHDRPFDLQKVSQIGCLVAGVDTYRENGATMFIPGSHRWDDNRKPRLDEICFAGKAFIPLPIYPSIRP